MPKEREKKEGISGDFRWVAFTDIGKVRAENQDTFVVDEQAGLFAVIDGMGGHPGGDRAAEVVAEELPGIIKVRLGKMRSKNAQAIRRMLRKSMVELNKKMLAVTKSESGIEGMGATVTAGLLREGRFFVVNIGDSKGYVFRNSRLRQLSKDHSVVSELVEAGRIEPSEGMFHPARGEITSYVGMSTKPEIHLRSVAAKDGDIFLLCSDGLTDMLQAADIIEILQDKSAGKAVCERLVAAANTAGGFDNITVLALDKAEDKEKQE